MRGERCLLEHLLFDLTREHVDPADYQHVIAAAGQAIHAAHRARGAGQQPGQVPGAIANHRHAFLGQGREYQLAELPVGQYLSGYGINDLRIEVVFPDGQPVLRFNALVRHPRAHHFGQAIDVQRIQPTTRFDRIPHHLRPRLGTEDSHLQRSFRRVQILPFELVGDVEHVGGRAHDDGGLEVLDQLHLSRSLATGHRYCRCPKALGTVMSAESAGKQPVTVCHVHDIGPGSTAGADGAGTYLGPGLNVLFRVADDGGLTGRAAGGMDTNDVVHRHGKHAKRVVLAEICLGGQRK